MALKTRPVKSGRLKTMNNTGLISPTRWLLFCASHVECFWATNWVVENRVKVPLRHISKADTFEHTAKIIGVEHVLMVATHIRHVIQIIQPTIIVKIGSLSNSWQ